MTAHRFFLTSPLPDDPAQRLPLAADDVRHAVSSLRVRPGEIIDVVDPDGKVWHVTVTGCSGEGVYGAVERAPEVARQPRVALFQAVAKGEKMDDIVRAAVEIGAEEIVPVLTRRSVVKLDARKRTERAERWRRVAVAAAKQSKRIAVPAVSDPVRLSDALPLLAAYDVVVVLWEEHEGAGVRRALRSVEAGIETRVALVVGPEGGFGAEEIEQLTAAGAVAASLGPTILRTETAAVVALTLAMATLGGLGDEDA